MRKQKLICRRFSFESSLSTSLEDIPEGWAVLPETITVTKFEDHPSPGVMLTVVIEQMDNPEDFQMRAG